MKVDTQRYLCVPKDMNIEVVGLANTWISTDFVPKSPRAVSQWVRTPNPIEVSKLYLYIYILGKIEVLS
jgi:hypothetical protein